MRCVLGFDGPSRPVQVRGNADAIADAVRNLVENAVHQSPAGGEVAVTVSEEGLVTVADRGPGVREADRQRIFERFWRGRGVTRQGAGLGLAIVALACGKRIGNASSSASGVVGASLDKAQVSALRLLPKLQKRTVVRSKSRIDPEAGLYLRCGFL